ncbi:MAG: NADH-quinone oxidoreductase subunit C [Candidatus Omnitrophica bacterium]|nr:NADH-quinone oxidoreductase subunit C [Candidatus Omnitrophota bacterium]
MQDLLNKIEEKFSDKILKSEEKSSLRIYLDFQPQDIPEVARFLFRDLGLRFAIATGIDTPSGIEILYHFSFDPQGKMISLRTIIPDKKQPQIQSITPIIRGAEWIEREIWELLGVNFIGHPNLKRLLLAEDWPQGKYPLRHEHESR